MLKEKYVFLKMQVVDKIKSYFFSTMRKNTFLYAFDIIKNLYNVKQ